MEEETQTTPTTETTESAAVAAAEATSGAAPAALEAAMTHTEAPTNQRVAVPEIAPTVLRADDSDKALQAKADAAMEAKFAAKLGKIGDDRNGDGIIGKQGRAAGPKTIGAKPAGSQGKPDPRIKAAQERQAKEDAEDNYQPTDIFEWANNIVQYKDELQFELFLVSRTNFLYRAKFNKDLARMMEPLFLDGLIDTVLDGAGTGMVVRDFDTVETEDNGLGRVRVRKIEKLVELFGWLNTQEKEIETFSDEEHDIKRIKGVFARVSHPELKDPFYVMKVLPAAMVMKGSVSWMLRDGRFVSFDAEAALRIPPDNQMLVLNQDMFVFNEGKLDTMFGYNAKKRSIAERKAAEISENYKLVFAEGLTLDSLVTGKKTIINKLQKLEVGNIPQDKLVEHAEDLELELMQNDDGAIIIMDVNDLTTFVNLLSDDYMESQLTGERYEIKSKKLIKPKEDPAAAPPLPPA